MLKGDVDEDQNIPDKEEDIRPRFHKSRMHMSQFNKQNKADGDAPGSNDMAGDDQYMNENDDEFDDGDDDKDDEGMSEWNLSKRPVFELASAPFELNRYDL